jgi:hypothetical protein
MQFENQFTKPWYSYAGTSVEPLNAKPAAYVIGTGGNTLTVKYGNATQGNGYKLAIALAATASTAMSVAFAADTLTITLGTDATVSPITADNAKNTYALIAVSINAINGFVATVIGSGVISVAAVATAFTNGQFGTVCPVPGTFVWKTSTEWYVNIAPNSKYDANWLKATLTTY